MTAARRKSRRGFTLLELVVTIGLMALLIGMIFAVASKNIALGNMVVEQQNTASTETAFFELLNDRFSSLPGNTRMELLSDDTGGRYLSDLTLQNVPLMFTWGGDERMAKTVQLSTVQNRDGWVDIVLRYYENEILEETQDLGDSTGVLDNEPFAEVVLLEDVYIFEWRVLDGRTMEWQWDWDLVGRLPLQLELTYMRDQSSDPIRHIFWITPKQNPEVLMRQFQQGGRGGGAAQGGGAGQLPNQPGGRPGGGEGRPGGSGQRPSGRPGGSRPPMNGGGR